MRLSQLFMHLLMREFNLRFCLGKFVNINIDVVGNLLPMALLNQRHKRNGNVGKHEERKRKHVENFFARGGANRIPLNKGSEYAKHKHEHQVVHQTEANRRNR